MTRKGHLFIRFSIRLYVIIYFVKKKMWMIPVMVLLLGCQNSKNDRAKSVLTAYEGYYRAIEENSRFSGESLYYSVDITMSEMPDHTYRYYCFIDDPQIAMYDITVMAVENGIGYDASGKMMPSVGIFEDMDFSMVPYQTYADAGFVKGVVISGETNDDQVTLNMLVEWKDKNHEKITREYLSYVVSPEGFYHEETASVVDGTAYSGEKQ